MKIIFEDKKNNIVKILIEQTEDLWYLEKIVHKGDIIEGDSYRVVEFSDKNKEKKKVHIELKVEKISFSKYSEEIKFLGTILSGYPEDFIQIGRHHSLKFSKGDIITLKKSLANYERTLIKEAASLAMKRLPHIILLDDKHAEIYVIRPLGLEFIKEINLQGNKRVGFKYEEFYKEISNYIKNKDLVIIATLPVLKQTIKKRFSLPILDISNADITGLREIIKNGTLSSLIGNLKAQKDEQYLERFLIALDKGSVVYGDSVKDAIEQAMVSEVLLDPSLLADPSIRSLLSLAEKRGAKIVILSDSPASEQLKRFSIIGFLRY